MGSSTPNLLKYSNGWGHLIMSIVSMGTAVFLLMQHDPSLEGLAIGMITTVMGYWYISSSVNHFKQQSAAPAAPPAAAPGGQTNVTQP